MPFWGAATLSGALFFIGLASLLRRRGRADGLCGTLLMLNAAILLAVAASADLGMFEGQALALLLVGVVAVEVALSARQAAKP
jgi:NADH:ubiquinone oxidoreductase subunit K